MRNTILKILAFAFVLVCVRSQTFDMFGSEFSTEPQRNPFAEMTFLGDDPAPEPVDPPKPDPEPKKPSTWDNLADSFMKLTNNWTRIVQAFKTTRSSVIKERLIGKGFDKFNESAQIQILKGIKDKDFDKFIDHLARRVKVPEERKEDLKMVLEESKWADSNVWTAFNTLFSKDAGGTTKFASIIISKDPNEDKYHVIFSDIKAEFALAPDVLVVNKKLSVLGGIWEDEKDEYVSVPKSLEPEDVQMVIQFFQIVAFKGFADQFGIKLDFPKL